MDRISPGLLIFLLVAPLHCLLGYSAHCQGNYSIHHYTNENGLPANGIKGLALDKETGFLWVGTQSGLVRFDGMHFKQFDAKGNRNPKSRIYFIAKNRAGAIFCEDENLSVYRIQKDIPVYVASDTLLFEWGAAGDRKAWSSPKEIARRLRSHPRSAFLPNSTLFQDELGDSSSFAFLRFERIHYYDAIKDTLLHFSKPFIQMFKVAGSIYFIDKNLEIWTYTGKLEQVPVKGMPYWDKNSWELPRYVWTPGMKDPFLIYKQNIWKLHRDDKALYLDPFCQKCCPDDAYIKTAQVLDERGTLFLGSEMNGLYVVEKSFARTIRTDTLVEGGGPEYAQAEINPGMITTGYGLSFSAGEKLYLKKTGIQYHRLAMYRDKSGDHWFRSNDTIFHYHREDGHCTKIAAPRTNKMVFGETLGRMYAVTDMAIAEITGDSLKTLYKLPYSTDTLINTLDPDGVIEWEPGVLAIAADKLILFHVERSKAYDVIPIPDLTTKVRSLLKYHDYLLIGTYGQGFYMYKNGVIKKMPLDKSGYLSYTHCFMPDDKGFCWISTNHGLFKASLQSLIAAYENDLSEIYYHYFGKADGIYNTEFNGGCQPCALRTSNGLFSFPSMNGIVLFDPHQQHAPPPPGQLFIEAIRSDTITYEPGDKALMALPYNLRNLSFQVALPQFGNAENIYFSYKLEPYHERWQTQELQLNNTLHFGRLPPGRYTLYLRVRNGFGVNQFGITTIGFQILSPWYQAWWFYLLCMAGLVLAVWALVKWRTARINQRKRELQQLVSSQTKDLEQQSRQLALQLNQLQNQQLQLEEDNNIKARLIGIISHDMISPLKFMAFMSSELGESFAPADPRYRKAHLIGSVAKDLESLSVNMLNWIRFHHESWKIEPEKFNLYAAIEEAVVIPAALTREKGVSFYNDVPEQLDLYHYRQIIGVIVYNLSMNAMKYTSSGEVRITCQYRDQGLSLSVADTGSGMPAGLVKRLNDTEAFVSGYSAGENKKYQFGYVIIKDLLRMVKGRMQVESVLNIGTRVTIHFPLPENTGAGN